MACVLLFSRDPSGEQSSIRMALFLTRFAVVEIFFLFFFFNIPTGEDIMIGQRLNMYTTRFSKFDDMMLMRNDLAEFRFP